MEKVIGKKCTTSLEGWQEAKGRRPNSALSRRREPRRINFSISNLKNYRAVPD